MFTSEEMLQITQAVNAGLKEVRWELTDFKSEVYKRFDAIDRRFESMEERFDAKIDALDKKFDTKIDALDKKFDTKIDALDKKFDAKIDALDKKFDARIDALDKKFDAKIDDRFETLDKKFDARIEEQDKKFDARINALEEKLDAKIDDRFETLDKKIDDRFNILSEQIMENRLIMNEIMETVNASHKKYERSAENVEWCDMQVRILGSVVSDHSERIARVEDKIAGYETGKKQDGDSVPSGKGKKRG